MPASQQLSEVKQQLAAVQEQLAAAQEQLAAAQEQLTSMSEMQSKLDAQSQELQHLQVSGPGLNMSAEGQHQQTTVLGLRRTQQQSKKLIGSLCWTCTSPLVCKIIIVMVHGRQHPWLEPWLVYVLGVLDVCSCSGVAAAVLHEMVPQLLSAIAASSFLPEYFSGSTTSNIPGILHVTKHVT